MLYKWTDSFFGEKAALMKDGKELLFADIWWQMMDTALLKWVLNLHIPSECHCTPTTIPACFETVNLQKGCVEGGISGSNNNTAYVCRSEYREVRWTDDLSPQERSLSDLIVSSTIYISNHFSCKLHASTLTRTKDGTINYRQIQVNLFLKDTRTHYVKYEVVMYFFIHRAEFDWSWIEICETEPTLPILWSADIKRLKRWRMLLRRHQIKGIFFITSLLSFCGVTNVQTAFKYCF